MSTPAPQWFVQTWGPAKAVGAAVVGFLAPGAAYLTGAAENGVTGNELVIAACWCVGGAAVSGGTVYALRNKAKATPVPPPTEEA
jgi:hypothetical protein